VTSPDDLIYAAPELVCKSGMTEFRLMRSKRNNETSQDRQIALNDLRWTLDVGRIFNLDGRENYREMRLGLLCCLTI
jgi:hypothetical protein